MPRIKRFDEVDTDSDFEFEEVAAPVKKTMPTLSFRTATTEDSDSIAFESDHEKSQSLEHIIPPVPTAPKAALPPTAVPAKVLPAGVPPSSDFVKVKKALPAAVARHAGKAMQQQASPPPPPVKSSLPQSTLAVQAATSIAAPEKKTVEAAAAPPAFPTAAAPTERLPQPTPPSTAAAAPYTAAYAPRVDSVSYQSGSNATAQHHKDLEDNSGHESDDFVQQVLPVHPRQQQHRAVAVPAIQRSPVPGASQQWTNGSADLVDSSQVLAGPAETAADELLIRAQLRLEERRRLGSSAPRGGSRQPSPWRGGPPPSAGIASATPYQESVARLTSTPMSPLTSADPRVRRLQQENARLQDEVAFLGRENQKMRGVQSSTDASEAVRLQLTVDMLRKDLETKQVAFQRALDDAFAEKKEALRQAGEAAEQCESYQSSADQYKQLYSDKQREVEKVKTQLQALLYDVNTMEQRHRELEAEYNERIASEREKTERAMALVDDVKGQRDHLQFLNEQLRGEVTTAIEARRQAEGQAAAANDGARRDRADLEQRTEQLNQDVAQLRKALAEKERVLAGQLREAQQAQAVMQDRLKEQAEEQQREADRSRRTVEAMKEDQRRALQQERARRAEVEERLRRVEEEARTSQTRYAAAVGSEAESRVRKFREELQAERVAREAAEREAARLTAEIEELRDASDYYQRETQRVTANFGQSEQLREKAERQCVSLSHTLEDMMAQDDAHARQIEELQEALSAAQWGSAGVAGRGADADGMVGDLQQLSDENDRLTSECTRLAEERDHLIEENGKIAEELLRWKQEMRQYVTSQMRPPSPQSRRLNSNAH